MTALQQQPNQAISFLVDLKLAKFNLPIQLIFPEKREGGNYSSNAIAFLVSFFCLCARPAVVLEVNCFPLLTSRKRSDVLIQVC